MEERGITSSVTTHTQHLGINTTPVGLMRPNPLALTLVASSVDHQTARAHGRVVAYLNHGTGQSFLDEAGKPIQNSSYVGTDARRGCLLFLAPGPAPAAALRRGYPASIVAEVGCPKLDKWIGHQPAPSDTPLVVFSFHWDGAHVCPEAGTAWREYIDAIPKLRGVRLAGHAHPRIAKVLRDHFRYRGINFIERFDEVLEKADVYATDGSSTLYEFAATGRPVIVLNSSTYRRDHHHGLRFWDAAHVGINVNAASELQAAVDLAVADPADVRRGREDALNLVYTVRDGTSTRQAVHALMTALERFPVHPSELT